MEAQYTEGKGLDKGSQHRQREAFGDALERADELELGDLVDEVDVIEALDVVPIALMNRIDAQEPGPALRARLSALADGDLDRSGLIDGATYALVGLRLPEVVQRAVGDRGQALEAGIAEDLIGTLTELAGGRAREGTVEGIDLGQQPHIGGGVAAGEGPGRRAAAVTDAAGVAKLLDESGHLGPGQTGDLAPQVPHFACKSLLLRH